MFDMRADVEALKKDNLVSRSEVERDNDILRSEKGLHQLTNYIEK